MVYSMDLSRMGFEYALSTKGVPGVDSPEVLTVPAIKACCSVSPGVPRARRSQRMGFHTRASTLESDVIPWGAGPAGACGTGGAPEPSPQMTELGRGGQRGHGLPDRPRAHDHEPPVRETANHKVSSVSSIPSIPSICPVDGPLPICGSPRIRSPGSRRLARRRDSILHGDGP